MQLCILCSSMSLRSIPLAQLPYKELLDERCSNDSPCVLIAQPCKIQLTHCRKAKLSRDVLNPDRVAFYWLNKSTLWTFYSPRRRRSDIEVSNNSLDMDSRELLSCYPHGNFFGKLKRDFTTTLSSLKPTFVPVRLVNLTVKHFYDFTLFIWFLYKLKIPLCASVTF